MGKMIDLVRQHAAEVRETVARNGGSNPRIFGSVARGDDKEGSDVDILITGEPGLTLFGIAGMELDLIELFGVEVDVVTEGEIPPASRERILGEAVAI